MTRRALFLPALLGLAAALSACGSFTRNCGRETRYESEYVYAEEPRQDVNVTTTRSPCERLTQTEVKRNPCDR